MGSVGTALGQRDLLAFQKDLRAKIEHGQARAGDLWVPALVAGQSWLFRASDIQKIVLPEKVSRVPGAAQGVAGVVSLNGTIFTLLDFNVLQGKAPVVRTQKSRIIFLDSQSDTSSPVALLVDRVLDLLVLNSPEIAQSEKPFAAGTVRDASDEPTYYVADVAMLSQVIR